MWPNETHTHRSQLTRYRGQEHVTASSFPQRRRSHPLWFPVRGDDCRDFRAPERWEERRSSSERNYHHARDQWRLSVLLLNMRSRVPAGLNKEIMSQTTKTLVDFLIFLLKPSRWRSCSTSLFPLRFVSSSLIWNSSNVCFHYSPQVTSLLPELFSLFAF